MPAFVCVSIVEGNRLFLGPWRDGWVTKRVDFLFVYFAVFRVFPPPICSFSVISVIACHPKPPNNTMKSPGNK